MHVTLPDGTQLEVADGASGLDVAAAIGPRLASATAAVQVDGKLQDLRLPVPDGATLAVVRVGDEEGLPVLRHSTAHVLAEAARHVFPGVKITIGPPIDNGFYYDFQFVEPITEADLETIEAEMRRILKSEHAFTRTEVTRDDARARFVEEGEPFKVELIDDLPAGEQITLYNQDDFTDLCRGPHLQSTGPIKAFKLLSLAGSYWRGDASREPLTRVYGTAFWSQKELDGHLHQIEEAKRRDHRRLGPQLGLFQFHPESPGAAFWLPNGMTLWNELYGHWSKENRRRGYREVRTPIMYDASLWKTSGHWDKYRENMYTLEVDEQDFAIKPMNCPAHCLIYKSERRSYRDLPLRINEAGLCHRNEMAGVLHGLMRVRAFTQDDAHLFVTEDQIVDEVIGVMDFATSLYELFDMDFRLELSTRPEQRVGDDALWDRAEHALQTALERRGVPFVVNEGDGAFYGPKIDAHLIDALGRSWQCGTFQLDFNFPERFDLVYTGADDHDHRPVMIHRAMLGSFERFIGILIEHYAGVFPLWLAPTQVLVLPIADRHVAYADEVANALEDAGLRSEVDRRGESVGKKISEAERRRVPVMLVVGDREAEQQTVSVRRHGKIDLGSQPLAELTGALVDEARSKRAPIAAG
jgi:threonyl-tRNA synthetase